MNAREQRGIELADKVSIKPVTKGVRGKWIVPSATGSGRYTVDLNSAKRCTCPDFELRRCKCKHVFAVEYTIRRQIETERHDDGSTTVTETVTETVKTTTPEVTTHTVTETTQKRTYTQNWPAYNAAQTTEKAHFQVLLHELCKHLPEVPRTTGKAPGGRKPNSYADSIFSAAFKVYSTVSGRRFISDLNDAYAKGYVTKCVHFNSIFNCLESEDVTPLLHALIQRSSLALKGVEIDFAVDSSGFSGSKFDKWFWEKYDADYQNFTRQMGRSDWLKVHLMCGVKTNVVTSVEVTGRYANDSPYLPGLVDTTAENFTMREVSADKGYTSINNLHAVTKHGAIPYIPFKTNTTGQGRLPGANADTGDDLWLQMWRYFTFHTEQFLEHYHKRSNVESTFSMIKMKFGDALRSKGETARTNEVLCKILCHNLCCVIQSIHELGIEADFSNGFRAPSAAPTYH